MALVACSNLLMSHMAVLLFDNFNVLIPLFSDDSDNGVSIDALQALHYDVRRDPHSIGSHVRDAAAYVCWASGQAYTNYDMKAVLEQLAPHLLTVACYDREASLFLILFYIWSIEIFSAL
jgi:hypothetical protein